MTTSVRAGLVDGSHRTTALLPVKISTEIEATPQPSEEAAGEQKSSGSAIHIELPGTANITAESGAGAALLRCV